MAEQKLHKRKAYLFTIILFVHSAFLNACAAYNKNVEEKDIFIDNIVEECIEIIPNEITYKNGSTYLNTKWKTIKSTGFCGCKSALLSYEVIAKKKGVKSTVDYNVLSTLDHDNFDFMVCSDYKQNYDSLEIYIQCKNPD